MPPPTDGLTLRHTAQLGPAALVEVRRLLDVCFDEGFGDADWDHALGGLHALVHVDGALVAHGSVVQRRLLHHGRALRAGYVEAVAVHPAARRRGHGSAVMAALEDVVRRGYDAGALGATDDGAPLYAARGWQPWRGSTWALTPSGRIRTPDDDEAVFVLPGTATLDLDGELTCDWRDGDLW
ncbi:GNAT family N-acetyltransferase [Blastococcus saxobsidens]|uniref:GNAT family N-acetyltransferase n=1 Tax=Blastococcus saxobsidens TaxID=138336 RepID=A0A6L9VYE5_9ACTN|nr:GNAT family N-acetyltransferase [Blastococcus saxobsidens]NEK84394.1 GNAT family N-acetyltransferase [Blastococcus saxobsidens]